MKKIRKFAAVFTAFAAALGMASCGGSDDSSSSSSKAPEEIKLNSEAQEQVNSLADQLEDVQLENTTIKFMAHWDLNPGDGQVVPPHIQMFRDKYNGTIEYVPTTWDTRYDDLSTMVISNKSPDFFPAMDMDGFPKGVIKRIFQPFDEYLDFDSDLWKDSKSVNDAFVFNGGHYVAATAAEPQYVCIYNPKTIEAAGLEDPAELFANDQWTMSKFKEMCVQFTDASKEQYGVSGWWIASSLNDACGYPLITMENGKLVSNIEKPEVAAVQDFMYGLGQAGVFCPDRGRAGGVGDGKTLFFPCGLWSIQNNPESSIEYGDVANGGVMFVPMPRMDDSDKYYISSRSDGYHLVAGAKNPKGVVAFLNCMQLCSKETQNITEDQLRNDYKWTEEMIAMRATILELCKTNAVFDFSNGVNDALTKQLDLKDATTRAYDTKEWSTAASECKAAVQALVDEANSQNADIQEDAEAEAEAAE